MLVLKTERLELHHLEPSDADFILRLLNELGFIRFVADRGLRTRQDAEAYILEKILPSYEKNGFGFYRVDGKEFGAPIGICGLAKREQLEEADIGFAILDRYAGRGYAFEAATATLEYGRKVLGLKSIIGLTAEDNAASQHLLEKMGMRCVGKTSLPGFAHESLIFRHPFPRSHS